MTNTNTSQVFNYEHFTIPELITLLLESHTDPFKTFFVHHCENVINFFSEALPTQSIYSWFFDEANPCKLPYIVKKLITQIENLSGITGFSFIRQFRLAKKLEISTRYLRDLVTSLKELGFLLSRRNRGINYKIVFDLNTPIVEYIEILISTFFEHYSGSCSGLISGSSSGSKQDFSIANLLYTGTCKIFGKLEDLIKKRTWRNKEKEASASATIPTIRVVEHKPEEIPVVPISLPTQQPVQQSIQQLAQQSVQEPNKGKYSLEIYRDYAKTQLNIENIDGFMTWLAREGKQDKSVAKFIAEMKEKLAGGSTRKPYFQQMTQKSLTSEQKTNENGENFQQNIKIDEKQAQETHRVLELLEIDRLSVQAWELLNHEQQNKVINLAIPNYKQKYPQVCAKMTSDGLRVHVIGLIKPRLGEMLYKANTNDLTELFKAVGKQTFDGLEDYEQADLQETKIEKIEDFYSSSLSTQQTLLEKISGDIYMELGIREMAKII